MKTKTLAFAAMMIVGVVAAQAQRWEWVRGYSSDYSCEIRGTVADDEGNLYVLGEFPQNAMWGGDSLLPTEHGSIGIGGPINTIVAKISPQGEMVWKKIVCYSYEMCRSHDIKKVGDSAFACIFEIHVPRGQYKLYWLDTLIVGMSDYPFPFFSDTNALTESYIREAFVMFDFDGNVIEQHFINTTYVDTNGNDIGRFLFGNFWFSSSLFEFPKFDIDSAGNIYLARPSTDQASTPEQYYSTFDGTISAVKVWVDNRIVGTIDIDHNIVLGSPHIMKFSPHFDTLLADRYVVQEYINLNSNKFYSFISLQLDKDANTYLTMNINPHFDSANYIQTIVFDSTLGITTEVLPYEWHKGVLIVLDSALTMKRAIYLQNAREVIEFSEITNVTFDNDSNIVFVLAEYSVYSGCGGEEPPTVKGLDNDTTLHGVYNDCIVLKFDRVTLEFKGMMKAPVCMCELGGHHTEIPNIVAKDNRVFIQVEHYGAATLPSGTYSGPNDYYGSAALVIFDYAGNVIGGDHYRQFAPGADRRNGPLVLVDSVLYVVQNTDATLTFGDTTVTPDDYHAYIAKYVDPAFMTPAPYTPADTTPGGPVEIASATTDNYIKPYPNPATDEIRVASSDGPILAAAIVSASGVRHTAALSGDRIDVSRLPAGLYFIQLTTQNGSHTLKFVKR